MADTAIAYRELFRCFVPNGPGEDPDDHEHDRAIDCDWGWACNQCTQRVDNAPCSTHAPTNLPGLVAVECIAEQRHYLFVYDNDGYGAGCPSCYAAELRERIDELTRCRHWAWRRWRWVTWLVARLPLAGYRHAWGNGCGRCLITTKLRWRWSS